MYSSYGISDGIGMWGSHSFNEISARARAAIGRFIRTKAAADDELDAMDSVSAEAGSNLSRDEYDAHAVYIENGQKVSIFVAKPSEPAYFDEMEEYAPTIVGTAKQEEAEEAVIEPVKRERFIASEPADLFINALRRPVRQRFDTSVPIIKKKAEVAATPVAVEIPAEEAVSETREIAPEKVEAAPETIDVVPVVEQMPVEVVAVPAVDEVVSLTDTPLPREVEITSVMEVPVMEAEPVIDEALLLSLEHEEVKIENEIARESMIEAVPVVVEKAEPIVAVPAMPKKFEIESLEPVVQNADAINAECYVNMPEAEMTSAEAVNIPQVSEIPQMEKKVQLRDESDILIAFRPELDEDRREFVSTSFDDNYAFREDYLDETERTFKIRASSVTPKYRFDGNFRSLRY